MMGKRPQAKTKWNLHLLVCVALFSITSSAKNFNEALVPHRIKTSGVKLVPEEDTGSTPGASPFRPNPALVHSPFQSDKAHSPQDIAALQDVSLTCATHDFVVRVKPSFYGLGADAIELRLGSSCQSNVLGPYGDHLFKYPLTACDSELELLPGYLVYKFVLHYAPSAVRFPSKAHPVTVNIECRYPRNYHMHLLAIQPTWETPVIHKRLKANQGLFQIQLMDDSWENPIQSRVFQLGETVNFQVSALHQTPGRKLYINSCYATPVTHPKSHIKFTLIDNYGCLLDSKIDPGASKFISRTDGSLRFSLKAFQFVTAPDAEISMHCQLYVTSSGPSPAHKSCTYTIESWEALSGDDAICECCDSQCVTSKRHRAMMDGVASSGSLWVSSHSDSNSRGGTSGVDKTHDTNDEVTSAQKGETADVIEIVKLKDFTSQVKDVKSLMEELQWSTAEGERDFEGEVYSVGLKHENYTAQELEYEIWKAEAADLLENDGEKENENPAGVSVKAEIEEVFEHKSDDDEELDGHTWYFAWR